MKYSKEEVKQYVVEEDVKFIRLAFCDVFGRQKNISIMPDELDRAFTYGIAFDASAIAGFGDEAHSDLFLHLELKDSANGYECVQAVQEHNLEDRTIYFGFYETPLKQVANADPTAVLGLSLDEKTTPTSASVLKKAENLGITILVCYKSKLSASRVETLHDEGYLVTAWTSDSKSDLQKMLNYGVDFILTNYPERGMELR